MSNWIIVKVPKGRNINNICGLNKRCHSKRKEAWDYTKWQHDTLKPLLSKSPDLRKWHSRQSQYGPELKYTLTTIKVWSYYSEVWGFGPTHPIPSSPQTPGHRVHRARLLADGSGSYFWIPQLCYARPLLRRTPQELSVSRTHAYVCLSGRP